MMKFQKGFMVWGAFACVLALSACSSTSEKRPYFRDRGKDYKTSKLIQPLSVPPDINAHPKTDIYPLPEGELALSIEAVSLAPPGFLEDETNLENYDNDNDEDYQYLED